VIPSKSVLAALVTTAALAGVAAPAAAQSPAFTAFATVCATPAADFAEVRKSADANGWGNTDSKSDADMPGVTIADQLNRANTVDKVDLVLSAWSGAKGAVKISDCTVHVAKSDFATLSGDAAAWLAFPAQESSATRATYRFTGAGGAHKALTSADFDAAAAGAGLEILTVSTSANGTVLDLMMIKK